MNKNYFKTIANYLMGSLCGISVLCAQPTNVEAPKNIAVYPEENINQLYDAAATQVINVVQKNPQAVIVLPTGSTPLLLYKEIINKFKNDPKIDFSKATFFNLDDYIDLEDGHPLGYQYYMNVYFYDPLKKIDPKRAPQSGSYNFPTPKKGETPNQAAQRYEASLAKAISTSKHKALDLVVLGVGGAYPAKDKLKGGHIAFNEPGTDISTRVHIETLSEKTRLDTGYRFSALRSLIKSGTFKDGFKTDVPTQAISVGLANILEAKQIMVLATGEDKAPVVEHALLHPESEDFPASHLQHHKDVKWYVDDAAAMLINDKIKPAQNPTKEQSLLIKSKASLEDFPKNKRVLVVSPHPDDDVICMSATIQKLLANGNEVKVVYIVTGSNAVRPTDSIYKELFPKLKAQNSHLPEKALVQLVKEKTREVEATRATQELGLKPEKLIFFKANYYMRRGIPEVSPLQADDLKKMTDMLTGFAPEIVFFAAENDPHGAHGLSTQLVAQAVKQVPSLNNIEFYGYRGAYAEWPLDKPTGLMIVPFDEKTMQTKIKAIKEHESQLDPLFPSFDPRPFWQRAYERNKESGATLNKHAEGGFPDYAEVFKEFSFRDFVNRYDPV